MSVEIKLGDIGFTHPWPTREWLEDAADREDECGGIVAAGSMESTRDCMGCCTCHDCIFLTMENAHAAELSSLQNELARLTRENEELRRRVEWQPIETAPKDCRPLLLWYPDGPEDEACMRVDCERTYRKERWWPGINGVKPTHWLPLPAVPEAKDNTPGGDAGKSK